MQSQIPQKQWLLLIIKRQVRHLVQHRATMHTTRVVQHGIQTLPVLSRNKSPGGIEHQRQQRQKAPLPQKDTEILRVIITTKTIRLKLKLGYARRRLIRRDTTKKA